MDLNKFKQANQIYASLADKTQDEAINQLNTYENLDQEVFKLVKNLIENSQKSSAYFDQKVSQYYQTHLNKSWHVGDQISGYELLELIGQGGMSMVYKAQRIDSETQKPVAIKLFNLPNQSPELKARFQVEQRILSGLSHPNIIEFHHGESTLQGDSFIVMELIDGGLPIDQYVTEKKLSTKEIIALLIQAADALQYAHNQLIIHRDVKPSNLMITDKGHLKVLDFGIAKLLKSDDFSVNLDPKGPEAQNTLMALTPSFASPEQINAKGIDITTDVFSLAAVAVFLLTRQLPFPSNRMLKSCTEDDQHVRKLLKSHVQDQDLRNILSQALQQNRTLRYSNMFAFKEDLNAWLAQKPVSASKDSWWYRLNRFAARRTALFATSVVLIITVIVAIMALSLQNQAIKLEADKADAVKQFMLDSFSVTDPNVSQGVDLSTKDLLRLAANRISKDEHMDPKIKYELFVALAIARGRLGYYPEAISLLNDALLLKPNDEQATALLAQYQFNSGQISDVKALLSQTKEYQYKSPTNQAMIIRVKANLLAQAGKYTEAFSQFNALKSLSLTDSDNIKNQALLAEIYFLKGEPGRSIEILQQLKLKHPMATTEVLNLSLNSDLVQYYDRAGNFKAAMALTKENIRAYRKILGDEHPDLGTAYNSLSAFQWLDGLLDEALASAETSKQIFRKRFGKSSEGLAQAHGNAGAVYYYQQKYKLAIEELTKAASMLADIFGEEHPETMNAKANLATILNATGNPEKALPILQNMYQIEIKTLGKSHRSALFTQQSLALNLANSGHYEKAIAAAQENIDLITQNYAEETNFVNHANSVMGRVYFMAGIHDLAIQYNLRHIKNWATGNENNYAQSLKQLAESYQATEQLNLAAEYYQRWTSHLAKIYGQTDAKYLDGLLQWAEQSTSMNQPGQASQLLSLTQRILTDNDLKLPAVQAKLQELSR